jgi:hypothetical protein
MTVPLRLLATLLATFATAIVSVAALPAPAAATPTIASLKVHALPIPGVRGSGLPGAGALIRGELKIAGSEYSGNPAPLTQVVFSTPSGTRLRPQGFPTCSHAVLEMRGPKACPRGSATGPAGVALGAVSFGGERVPEQASIQGFFAPGGGYYMYIFGHTPALVEIIGDAHTTAPVPPYGPQVIAEIPLIETVPGAADASFLEGAVEVGATRRQDRRTISLITLPNHCPHGGWEVKAELSFLGGTVSERTTRMPCPR